MAVAIAVGWGEAIAITVSVALVVVALVVVAVIPVVLAIVDGVEREVIDYDSGDVGASFLQKIASANHAVMTIAPYVVDTLPP